MKMKAYLTIYLAMLLTVLLALVMALLAGVQKNTIRTEEEFALNTAGYSALAEYDRELLEQYDLFFIDASYGSRKPDIEEIGGHIKKYANKNLEDINLFNSRMTLVGIQDAEIATDQNGAVLKQQIINYEKNYFGMESLEKLFAQQGLYGEQDSKKEQLLKKRDENAEKLASAKPPVKTVEKVRYNEETGETETYEEEEEVPIEDPAAYVNELRKGGILNLLIDDFSKISAKNVCLEEYVSYRGALLQGTGILQEKTKETSFFTKSEEKILLTAYISQKYGCYGKEKENAALNYQVEYLLGKKGSDMENLKEAAEKLLLIREASNAAYLYGDAAKRAEIAAMAASVSAVALAPYLQPLLETSILFAWAYIESIQDVKQLLAGGKIPLIKSAADWRTDLSSILQFEGISSNMEGTKGLSYEQYLSMLLLFEKEETLLFSMMDVMEMDIRKTVYHENFRMDGCVSGFRAAAKFEDDSGGCSFLRAYYY